MDFTKLFARITGILTNPSSEWPRIVEEPATVAALYKNYILWLAAIPAVCGFIGMSLIGTHIPLMGTTRMGIGAALTQTIIGYAVTLAGVYLMALIIGMLASAFGGRKDMLQALKVAAYASTASWVAGFGQLLPWVGGLIALAGMGYSIYLLYLGLPPTMKCPQEKAKAYTATVVVIAILAGVAMSMLAGSITGQGMMMNGAGSASIGDQGNMEKRSQDLQEASGKLEAAQKSGDIQAQRKAMKAIMAATLGNGKDIKALAPDRLKQFVPERLAGIKRVSFSATRNSDAGVQVSTAKAYYNTGGAGASLHLNITDAASVNIFAVAPWSVMQQNRKWDQGYEKSYRENGRQLHEKWDGANREGEIAVVLGQRFVVRVSGRVDNMDQLKSALNSLNLDGIEALRNEGVK